MPLYRRVTAKGVKPIQMLEPIYEYYWLYGAVEPKTGETFFLEMPWLDGACFSVFLEKLAEAYPDSLNILLIDGAPAHRAATVKVPENIILVDLPPYSPELNPIERLWLDVKKQIDVFDRKVRTSIDGLKEHIAGIINNYTDETIKSLTGYPYILKAANVV